MKLFKMYKRKIPRRRVVFPSPNLLLRYDRFDHQEIKRKVKAARQNVNHLKPRNSVFPFTLSQFVPRKRRTFLVVGPPEKKKDFLAWIVISTRGQDSLSLRCDVTSPINATQFWRRNPDPKRATKLFGGPAKVGTQ